MDLSTNTSVIGEHEGEDADFCVQILDIMNKLDKFDCKIKALDKKRDVELLQIELAELYDEFIRTILEHSKQAKA
jgi:hypothetical protein